MEGDEVPHRSCLKDKGSGKDRSIEQRRRISESLLRRQRGTTLNARRKLKLLEIQNTTQRAECKAPILFSEDETQEAIRGAVQGLHASNNETDRLHHVQYLRYLLTDSEEPPYLPIRRLNALPLLVSALNASSTQLKTEALWSLAVMADGDFPSCQQLLQHVTDLLPFLNGDGGPDLAELAAWIFRSLCLTSEVETQFSQIDVATPLTRWFFDCMDINEGEFPTDVSLTAAWALCSLISHSPSSRQRLLNLPHFTLRLSNLLAVENGRVVMEAAWLIAYLAAADDHHLFALIEANVMPHLVDVLKRSLQASHPDLDQVHELLTPILRSIGNIVAGISKDHVRELVLYENGIMLSCFSACLGSEHRGIQKEACKTLSNIAAGSDRSTIEILVNSAVLDPLLSFICQAAFDIKREAAFVIANICFNDTSPNVDLLKFLLNKEQRLLLGFVSLMKGVDVEAVKLGLDFTQLVLEKIEEGAHKVEEVDGIDAMEQLQFREVPTELQDLSAFLVDTYFGEDYGI